MSYFLLEFIPSEAALWSLHGPVAVLHPLHRVLPSSLFGVVEGICDEEY